MLVEPKCLVISTVGDSSLHRNWCKSNLFDTCLIYYGDSHGFPHESKFYKKAKGPKFHLIADILEEYPNLQDYTYIWMPDDDVFLNRQSVEKLFKISLDYKLSICQPSIIGWYGTTIPLCCPGTFLRYTNWVEIMCPCMSKSAIKICKQTFRDNITGWSIDAAWNVLLGHPKNKIAIVDDLVALHTRKVFGGDTYHNLSEADRLRGARLDSMKVREKYNLVLETSKDDGESVGQGEIFNAVVYSKVLKDMEGVTETEDRFWPPQDILEQLIKKIRNPSNFL